MNARVYMPRRGLTIEQQTAIIAALVAMSHAAVEEARRGNVNTARLTAARTRKLLAAFCVKQRATA